MVNTNPYGPYHYLETARPSCGLSNTVVEKLLNGAVAATVECEDLEPRLFERVASVLWSMMPLSGAITAEIQRGVVVFDHETYKSKFGVSPFEIHAARVVGVFAVKKVGGKKAKKATGKEAKKFAFVNMGHLDTPYIFVDTRLISGRGNLWMFTPAPGVQLSFKSMWEVALDRYGDEVPQRQRAMIKPCRQMEFAKADGAVATRRAAPATTGAVWKEIPGGHVLVLRGLPFVEGDPLSGPPSPEQVRDPRGTRGYTERMLECWSRSPLGSAYYSAAKPVEGQQLRWRVDFSGLTGGRLSDLVVPCEVRFPEDFPNHAPRVFALKRMVHPNVSELSGEICASILATGQSRGPGERWLAAFDLEAIAISVLSALEWPESDSPLNARAAQQLRDSPR